MVQVVAQKLLCSEVNRHQTLLGTFAEDAQDAYLGIKITQGQPDEFRDAQTGGVQKLQHHAVTEAQVRAGVGLVQQAVHLCAGQKLRQLGRKLGILQQRGWVLFQ